MLGRIRYIEFWCSKGLEVEEVDRLCVISGEALVCMGQWFKRLLSGHDGGCKLARNMG